MPEPQDPEPQGEPIPLDILYEDAEIIVINKPPGLVVHPGAGNWTGTLVNALIHHCGDSLSGIGGVRRPGIVHRLDKDTSGVMVVAKTDAAHRALSEAFADHGRSGDLERAYQALVWGAPARNQGTIDAPLGRARDRVLRAVVPEGRDDARHAITRYTVLERFPAGGTEAMASFVECRLETGRTHQIRVHMAHIGHPRDRRPRLRQGVPHQGQPPARAAAHRGGRLSAPGAACLAACISPSANPYIDAVRGADARRHGGTGHRIPGAEGLASMIARRTKSCRLFGKGHAESKESLSFTST